MKSFYTPKELTRIIKISYRQIQYWDVTKFIGPSYRRRGKYRLYTFSDLVQLYIAELVRAQNISIQRLRKIVKNVKNLLPRLTFPLSDATFLIDDERVLIFSGELLIYGQLDPSTVKAVVGDLRKRIELAFPEDAFPGPDPKAEAIDDGGVGLRVLPERIV